MYIDWQLKYHEKYGFDDMPNFLYPLKEKYAKMFKDSKDMRNELYKYCYKHKINIKDTIEYPSKKTLDWMNSSGVLY